MEIIHGTTFQKQTTRKKLQFINFFIFCKKKKVISVLIKFVAFCGVSMSFWSVFFLKELFVYGERN